MRRFFSRIGSLFRKTSPAPQAPTTVEDAEFTFREKPTTPVGLEHLRVERLGPDNTLLLTGFHSDLTVDQTYLDESPAKVASASRSLRWAVKYHGLDAEPPPPVRLHRNNVLLVPRHQAHPADRARATLTAWLDRFGWDAGRPLRFEQASAEKPVEDGFFRCLRAVPAGCDPDQSDGTRGVVWQPHDSRQDEVPGVLTRFMEDEIARVGAGPNGCEQFLVGCYNGVPRERLTHPAFALLDFPAFDMGCVQVEFAGSIWSPDEIHFWSRPAYFHK